MRMVGGALARLGRGARRLPWVIAAAVLVVITVVAVSMQRGPTGGDPTRTSTVRVGVASGAPIDAYLASARAELAGTARGGTPIVALVGFVRYVEAVELGTLLDGAAVSLVLTRVPLPGEQSELLRLPAVRLPDDVVAGMDAAAVRKDAEAVRYAGLADGAADPERRSVYAAAARVATAEAVAYRRHCACAYAAVIRAVPDVLATLGSGSEVRFVDPAPEVRRLDRAVFLPPLPDQVGLAGPP
ncbi:MAG TPA: hypothetical protein VK453_09565 [Micromonosporaceae bacterium]|nr:hypothetical protein [Micromonosporaceae bacterium]